LSLCSTTALEDDEIAVPAFLMTARATSVLQLDSGTRAGGFVLTRQEAAGKWGKATYSLVGT
jgi:hypothetical protein